MIEILINRDNDSQKWTLNEPMVNDFNSFISVSSSLANLLDIVFNEYKIPNNNFELLESLLLFICPDKVSLDEAVCVYSLL